MIIKENIDGGKAFDFGRASADYAKYRDIYPKEFYEKILSLGLCKEGQRVLDLGTGTGVLPRNLYKHGASFVGADISENQIAEARKLSEAANMDIEYLTASAENFNFPDKSFDAVTASQCFTYFDREKALPRIHKSLKDGGHFCILFTAWLPDESEIARRTEELILKYNPEWSAGGMKRFTYTCGEAEALFEIENSECFDVNIHFTRESWHGRMKSCRGIGASSLPNEKIAAFNSELFEYLQSVPERFDILHFVTVLNLRKK